jgi:hypothetical protein
MHGTWILGTLAAYKPGGVVGAAYRARFVLAKTEDYASETAVEEDFYVAGLEFIEAHGGSVSAGNRPGGGAQFIVRIPQNEAAPTTP